MNFEILNIRQFQTGVDVFRRIFRAIIKKNGLIRIINVVDGNVLFDEIDPDDLTISGNPMGNILELQTVIFNHDCICEEYGSNLPFKIFDRTFEETFE